MYTLKDFKFKDKKVLLRADFNVPITKFVIQDDSRIKKTIPTIEYILSQDPKQLILMSHLGRPEGKYNFEFSMKPVAERLEKLLGKKVSLAHYNLEKIQVPKEEQIVMLENVRFEKGEEKNDDAYARRLAALGNLFVFDAFGVSHREQASVTGIMKYKKTCAGFLMEKEVKFLRDTMKKPKRPFVAIIGGAKADKIEVIDQLVKKVDSLIISGVLANTFLKARAIDIGASKYDDKMLGYAQKMLEKYPGKIHLPVDFILADRFDEHANTRCAGLTDDMTGWMIMDIGPYTISGYKELLGNAKTVVWAGPIGVFEWEPFRRGTWDIASYLADLNITKIIGGGDSGDAIEKFGLSDKMTLVSTGGGASLELLSGKTLPAIKSLDANQRRFWR